MTAESVYEAAALGLSRLRRDEWAEPIAPGTPIEIIVREPATTHTVSLGQIRRWSDGVAVSPDEVLKRKRVVVGTRSSSGKGPTLDVELPFLRQTLKLKVPFLSPAAHRRLTENRF